MNFDLMIRILEVILLLITAFLIPILNIWFENKLGKVKEEIRKEYFSKESAAELNLKVDRLIEQFDTLNKFLLENWSKR
jgi:hypothetical protein